MLLDLHESSARKTSQQTLHVLGGLVVLFFSRYNFVRAGFYDLLAHNVDIYIHFRLSKYKKKGNDAFTSLRILVYAFVKFNFFPCFIFFPCLIFMCICVCIQFECVLEFACIFYETHVKNAFNDTLSILNSQLELLLGFTQRNVDAQK